MENSVVNWADLPRGPLWLTPPGATAAQTRSLDLARARAPGDPEMVWVASSGTTAVDQLKVLGLTRAAILNSAAAVNAHLGVTPTDRWLRAIPSYHVGGLAIAARAHLGRNAVDELPRWDARAFATACARHGTTLSALVPTQIFDLVAAGEPAPPSVRAIVVGGGALDPALYRAARARGWPVLPSYGLTETASQVATAGLDSGAEFPDLEILSHAEVRADDDGRLRVRATSLARVRVIVDGDVVTIDDPRDDGWLITEDLGELVDGRLRVKGRRDDVIKILGVLVSIPVVEAELGACLGADAASVTVLSVADARRGHDLIAVTDQTSSLERLARALEAHNAAAPGPRRVERLLWTPGIPRTALGKIKRAALREALGLA